MAGGLPDLVARVRLDTSDLDGAVGRASKVGSAIGSAVGNLASGGISAAIGGVRSFATGAVDAFAAVEDATGAAGVQFGKTLPGVVGFAERAAQSFGISKRGALDAANTFGTLGKSAGLSGTDLAGFANKFTGLAGDLASFKGTSPEQAIEAIGAALRGETEPIRAYGVLIDDAALRQEALAQGLIKTTKEALTPQQKVLASQALILKQTTDAQGDFQRTSDSTANTQKRLAAETENAQAALGAKLAPAITVARQAFLELVQGSGSVIDKLGQVADRVQPIVAAVATGLGPAVSTVVSSLQSLAAAIPTPVLTGLGIALGTVAAAMLAQVAATTAWAAVTGVAAAATGLFAVTVNAETGAVQRGLLARIAHNVAVAASTAVHVAAAAATGVWTAAQWLLNAALNANPIGLIVIALAALVGGLILAYKNSETFRAIVDKAFAAVKAAAQTLANFVTQTIPAAFQAVKDKVTSVAATIVSSLAGAWASVKSGVTGAWDAVKSATSSAWEAVKRAVSTGVDAVVAFVRALPGKATSALSALGSSLAGVGRAALSALGTAVSGGLDTVLGTLRGVAGRAASAVGNLGSALVGAGRELMAGLARGVADKIGDVIQTVRNGLQRIKNMLPGSPIKDGPLKSWNNGGAGKRLMGMLESGVAAGAPGVAGALSAALADAARLPDLQAVAFETSAQRATDHRLSPATAEAATTSGSEAVERLLRELLTATRENTAAVKAAPLAALDRATTAARKG